MSDIEDGEVDEDWREKYFKVEPDNSDKPCLTWTIAHDSRTWFDAGMPDEPEPDNSELLADLKSSLSAMERAPTYPQETVNYKMRYFGLQHTLEQAIKALED